MSFNPYPLLENALLCQHPFDKCEQTFALKKQCDAATSLCLNEVKNPLDFRYAGHPNQPELVPPNNLKHRKINTQEGYAALLHAIAHIEFNAINLALDAAYRFRGMGESFVRDWVKIAAEEAQHFLLMRERLTSFGYDYGDFPAHNHLWDMAWKTAFCPLLRMALVPRVLEARGLDVTPDIRKKAASKHDTATCEVLDIIYRDEIHHVERGNFWYHHLCQERKLEPISLFKKIISSYGLFIFRGYVNLEAREKAGFSTFELALLEDFEQSQKLSRPGDTSQGRES